MDGPAGSRKQRRSAERGTRRQREEEALRSQRRRRRRAWLGWSGGGIVALALLVGVVVATRAQAAPTIDGLQCVSSEGSVTHTHQHLDIYNAGQPVPVPQGMGVNNATGCLFALHTHSPDGVIHVESSSQDQNTLGQFFDIWGQPLSQTQVAAATTGHGQSIRAYVNGHLYAGNPRAIPLTPHALITLEVGPPWAPSTTRFSWPGGT